MGQPTLVSDSDCPDAAAGRVQLRYPEALATSGRWGDGRGGRRGRGRSDNQCAPSGTYLLKSAAALCDALISAISTWYPLAFLG